MDQAIEVEEDRVVCIRFGHDWDPQCMVMDETLYGVQAKLQNFAVIYLGKPHRAVFSCLPDSLIVRRVAVDITKVPDFNKASPLDPTCTEWRQLMFPLILTQRCMSCTTLARLCSSTGMLILKSLALQLTDWRFVHSAEINTS